ncbi:hypothetical protein KF840_11140 [bacterium]|nr:hypothetical protein [bacterium]
MRRRLAIPLALLLGAAAATARVTPGPAVTDANVLERVRLLRSPAEQLALADYYAAKAAAEGPRIDFYEQLFRAYNALEGKAYDPLREQARDLLKAARQTRKHLEILATAHRNRATAP